MCEIDIGDVGSGFCLVQYDKEGECARVSEASCCELFALCCLTLMRLSTIVMHVHRSRHPMLNRCAGLEIKAKRDFLYYRYIEIHSH